MGLRGPAEAGARGNEQSKQVKLKKLTFTVGKEEWWWLLVRGQIFDRIRPGHLVRHLLDRATDEPGLGTIGCIVRHHSAFFWSLTLKIKKESVSKGVDLAGTSGKSVFLLTTDGRNHSPVHPSEESPLGHSTPQLPQRRSTRQDGRQHQSHPLGHWHT